MVAGRLGRAAWVVHSVVAEEEADRFEVVAAVVVIRGYKMNRIVAVAANSFV
jgi:hypothetical protein